MSCPKTAFLLNSRLIQISGKLAIRPAEATRKTLAEMPKLAPICSRRRAPDTP